MAVCDTLLQAIGTGEELLPTVTLGLSEVTYMDRMSEQASWGSGGLEDTELKDGSLQARHGGTHL